MKRLPLVFLSILVAAAAIGGAAYYRYTHPLSRADLPATTPATTQTTKPATALAVKRKPATGPATQLLDIVRAGDPKYPTTQRLESALDLRYAAHIVLADPVHLDTQGNLWITRDDAPEQFNFLKASESETATHVVRDAVVFVLWSSTENGKWLPYLIVKNRSGAGYQLVDYEGRRTLADPYGFDWGRALVLPGRQGEAQHIVVPTATGVCAFAFEQTPDSIFASHQVLIDPTAKDGKDRAVQLVMDVEGVIAYVTNAAGTKGAKGATRFGQASDPAHANYKWNKLTGWPDHLLHLVPLLDGSVLQIVSDDADEKDKVIFSLNSVAPVVIDQKKVLQLVGDLSAPEPEKRDAAFNLLTTYGPGISPLLESVLDIQPVEAQIRIRQLLKNKIEPSLGSMTLNDGKMRVVNRLPDGGVIFFAEGGVAIPRPDDTPNYITPAWLCIRPGRAVELLPPALVTDLRPEKQKIIAWGLNDFVVLDPVLGPQWYIGNRLEPMLRKQHRRFTQFVGIDSSGRWIFRAPPVVATSPPASNPSSAPTTTPATITVATSRATKYITATSQDQREWFKSWENRATTAITATSQESALSAADSAQGSTLIIDPHLPDITPRLPGWQLPVSSGKVGWDKNDWPVIYMDIKPDPVPWALEEGAWRVIDEKKEKVFTDPNDIPKSPSATIPVAATIATAPTTTNTQIPATTNATTTSADTRPATEISVFNTQDLLLTTPDGMRYYDGRQSLNVVRADGSRVAWLLPELAVGAGRVTLLRNRENLLFLCNSPGRIVRLRPTPEEDQPFRVDAVFTRTVPADPNPLRIWLDPADRICIAHSGNCVTILFTIGRIPPAIAEKMRLEDFPAAE